MAATELTALGKYDVVRILGRGAMGTVYEGFDPIIDRRVAIKTVGLDGIDDPETAEDLLRFKREAQAAGRLTHPNIVGVYDYGETETLAYIVMEYVEGDTLKAMIDHGERFTAPDAIRMMESLLAGLAYSHQNGVIHRDIKPANVMITKDGRLKLADFGVARIESSSLTQAGTMIGTPSYMSPEQFMGQTIDARTDIYSAGVLMYQLLTGEKPFEGSVTAIMHKVLNVEPPAPSALSVSVSPALDAVVRRAMAKRPEDRFATAADFAAALHDDGGTADQDATMIAPTSRATPAARTTTAPSTIGAATPPAAHTSHRSAPIIGGIALLVVLLGGGGAFFLFSGKPQAIHTAPNVPVPATSQPSAKAKPATAPTPKPAMAPAQSTTPSSTTTSAPSPAVAPAPITAPTPTVTPAEIEARLGTAIASSSCAMISGTENAGQYTLDGLVGAAHRAALSGAINTAADGASVQTSLSSFTGPYCGLLDVARHYAPVFAPASSRLDLHLAGHATRLRAGETIAVRLRAPGWANHLELDYVSSNGQVYRIPTKPTGTANGLTIDDQALGQVGPPFGRDMILAIASDTALPAMKSQVTSTTGFQPLLKAMLADIRQKGGRVETAALILDTKSKP